MTEVPSEKTDDGASCLGPENQARPRGVMAPVNFRGGSKDYIQKQRLSQESFVIHLAETLELQGFAASKNMYVHELFSFQL